MQNNLKPQPEVDAILGSYGSLPLPVIEATEKLGREIEANPDKYLRFTYMPLLVTVRSRLATMINAAADECVLSTNATHAVSTILHNFAWEHGDVLVGGEFFRWIQKFILRS